MKKTVLRFGSLTYAMKAQKRLKAAKIDTELVKFDNTELNEGCTYALKIDYADFYAAAQTLKAAGVGFSAPKSDNGG